MAKQTVINFLKTCLNIYIVLLGSVLSNKSGPKEAGTAWPDVCVRWFLSRKIITLYSQFFHNYWETQDGNIVHLAARQQVH